MKKPLCILVLLHFLAITSSVVWAQQVGLPAPDVAPVEKRRVPLLAEDLLMVTRISPSNSLALDPLGEWLAYTLERPQKVALPGIGLQNESPDARGQPEDLVNHRELWIQNLRTRESQRLIDQRDMSWGPAWSPDGSLLAFCSDHGGTINFWVWEKNTGIVRKVGHGLAASIRPRNLQWSVDGKYLFALVISESLGSKRVSASASTDSIGTATLVAGSTVRVITTRPKREAREVETGRVKVDSRVHRVVWAPQVDLVRINVSTGTVDRWLGDKRIRGFFLSPDARGLAATVETGSIQGNPSRTLFDLLHVSFSGGQVRILASDIPLSHTGRTVSWSPDSNSLAYISEAQCFVVRLEDRLPRRLTPGPLFFTAVRPPLWDDKGNLYLLGGGLGEGPLGGRTDYDALWKINVVSGRVSAIFRIPGRSLIDIVSANDGGKVWTPDDGQSVYLMTRKDSTKEEGFFKANLEAGTATPLFEEGRSLHWEAITLTNVSSNGGRVAFTVEDAKHPREIWVADVDFRNRLCVTQLNPQLSKFPLGDARLVEWQTVDGDVLQGTLIVPPTGCEPGRGCPLIVWVYGGIRGSEFVNRFGGPSAFVGMAAHHSELFASRGYAVLFPDAPLRVGTPMQDVARTVMPGIEKVIELGIADPERLGVLGHSYGGYSTVALLVQTTRFKAAVTSAGAYNLTSFYGMLSPNGDAVWAVPWLEEGQGRMGVSPWDDMPRYIANSPWFQLSLLRTPLLIIVGEEDPGAAQQADELFVGLRRLGRMAELARYRSEGHTILRYKNQLDYSRRILQWFDEMLR